MASKRKGTVAPSRPNYFLCSDRHIIRQYRIHDPCHFVTNHKLVFGTLTSNTLKENKYYLHGRTKFPHQTSKMGPSMKLDSICHDIEQAVMSCIFTPEQRNKCWISVALWLIVDQKNSLCKLLGPTNHTEYRGLTHSLKASLKEDRKQ